MSRTAKWCILRFSLAMLPVSSFADSIVVADSLTEATTPGGAFISWREHIIDDPVVGGEPDLAGSDGLEIADLDGDGYEDIVSVHEADIVYDGRPVGFVRIAWGTIDPNRWVLTTLSSGPEAAAAEDVSIADANGDGFADIVVATELAHLIYFQNPGREARTGHWERTIPAIAADRGSFIRVFFADLDDDGTPEIVAANKGDQNAGVNGNEVIRPTNFSIFILPSDPLNGNLWREQVLGKGLVPINSEPVDIDQDGDLDIVAGLRSEGRVLWFENLGKMRFREHKISIEGNRPEMSLDGFNMDYADINGDGRLDIVTGGMNVVTSGASTPTGGQGIVETTLRAGPLFWLEQPAVASDQWVAHEIGSFSPDLLVSVRLADIDGDGDLDAFAGSYSLGPRDSDGADIDANDQLGRIGWFENPGVSPEERWKRHDISRRKRGMYDKWIARDLDSDGDLDFIGTRGNSYPYDGVVWIEQIRTMQPGVAFTQARETDSEQMPLPAGR